VSARLRVNVCRYRRFHAAEHTLRVQRLREVSTWLRTHGLMSMEVVCDRLTTPTRCPVEQREKVAGVESGHEDGLA
jgi:hypothetical protein